jgi:hypothetical protein
MSRMSGREFAPRDGFKVGTLNLMRDIRMSRYAPQQFFWITLIDKKFLKYPEYPVKNSL